MKDLLKKVISIFVFGLSATTGVAASKEEVGKYILHNSTSISLSVDDDDHVRCIANGGGSAFCKNQVDWDGGRIDVDVKDVNVDVDDETSLRNAVLEGDIKTVKYLVEEVGADVNATDEEGATLVHWATLNGHTEIVKYLKEAGADVNARDKKGITPSHIAALNGHTETVKYLVEEAGAYVDARDSYGITPSHVAALNGHTETVKYLVEEVGVDVNAVDIDGMKPLHFAALKGHTETIEYLVEEVGADVNAIDRWGKTPIDYTIIGGHSASAIILRKNGAKMGIELREKEKQNILPKPKNQLTAFSQKVGYPCGGCNGIYT